MGSQDLSTRVNFNLVTKNYQTSTFKESTIVLAASFLDIIIEIEGIASFLDNMIEIEGIASFLEIVK